MAERIKKGMAIVQFLALQEFIRKRLSEGYSYKLIYEELYNEGKFTASYKTLSRYIKDFGLKQQFPLSKEKVEDKKVEQHAEQPTQAISDVKTKSDMPTSEALKLRPDYNTLIADEQNNGKEGND